MHQDTGEIKNLDEIKRFFEADPKEKEKWFLIDNEPNPKCKACEGNGYVGYFPNSKVIPCVCIFETDHHWSLAIIRQRDLPKASKDKGLKQIQKGK